MMASIPVTVYVDTRDIMDDIDDGYIRDECDRRGIKLAPLPISETPRDARTTEMLEDERYRFDTLMHELREAFLSRDLRHFDVVLGRLEGRYREVAVDAIASEMREMA